MVSILTSDAASIRQRFTRADEKLCPRSLVCGAQCKTDEMPHHDAAHSDSKDQSYADSQTPRALSVAEIKYAAVTATTAASTA
jgi:hypothetical protein